MRNAPLKIYIAGHRGMVGSAIKRVLSNQNVEFLIRTHSELDLTNQQKVLNFFETEKPDQVFLTAARVGGIHANNEYPAEFIYQNLMIEANVINAAFQTGVKKLLFTGSSCIYPRLSKQPIKEESLLSGYLELTNEPYAIAKIAGIKLCESYNRQYGISHGIDYRSIMPTNLYGIGDKYDEMNSHVIPALILKFHKAVKSNSSSVEVWGSGEARREFLNVDDLASAVLKIMNLDLNTYKNLSSDQNSHINVGYGSDITIRELAETIADVTNFSGTIEFNKNMPEGTPRKLLDSARINSLGWKPKISLKEGLKSSYENFLKMSK